MTSYVNCGVRAPFHHTKKALREAVAANPAGVEVYCTSEFGDQFDGFVSNLIETPHLKLSVCGPDPYRDRKWYATIAVHPKTKRIVVT